MKNNFFSVIIVSLIVFLAIAGIYTGNPVLKHNRMETLIAQVGSIKQAVAEFKNKYHYLPGDLKDAGKVLPGCPGPEGSDCDPFEKTAGDGIVGEKSFAKTWKPQVMDKTHVPAASAADETVLFWTHLHYSSLPQAPSRGTVNALPVEFGSIYPETSFSGAGFIVGYADGRPPADFAFDDARMKGTVLLLVTTDVLQGKAGMDTKGSLPLSPYEANIIDRDMDDGYPNTGAVQAYGNRDCVVKETPKGFHPIYRYDNASTSHDCGLMFLIEPQDAKKKAK